MSHGPALKDSLREAARPYFRSEERWSATGFLVSAIGAQLDLVATAVATNYWRNAFGFVTQFGLYTVIGILHPDDRLSALFHAVKSGLLGHERMKLRPCSPSD